jgi:cation:H+ antiporter
VDIDVIRWVADEEILHDLMAGLSVPMLLVTVAAAVVVLSKGADWLIVGVVDLAERTGVPKIVIGATVVSLGTTLPEAFVSVMAAFLGNPGLALGNGVGSIIADTGLIFGLTCLLVAVPVNRFILNRTGWVQLGSAALLVGIAVVVLLTTANGEARVLGRWVGVLFLVLLAGYMYLTYRWSRQGPAAMVEDEVAGMPSTSLPVAWTMIVGGLVMIIAGARVLVPAASEIATRAGVPEDVIAATLVAFGTSLPELMTAISAIRRGHPEITVGNIVGADVLNVLFVIGAAAIAAPLAIPDTFYYFHFPAMMIILISFRVFISTSGTSFRRWHGMWLLSAYAVYVVLQYTVDVGGPL